jgi:hypothetical protein
VAGQVFQFWIDPAPGRDSTRIVIERTDAKRVSGEVVVRRSIILDHIPTNFDVAFTRAREVLMLDRTHETKDGHLSASLQEKAGEIRLDDDVEKASGIQGKTVMDGLWGTLAKVGLAGTSNREGGQGHAIDDTEKAE